MRSPYIALSWLLASIATHAVADTHLDGHTGKAREQVRNELAEAARSGSLIATGEAGLSLRELAPQRYPAAAMGNSKSREKVRYETMTGLRQGELVAGESGLTLREQHPHRYPAAPRPAVRTRAQVLAELRDARLAGELIPAGEGHTDAHARKPQAPSTSAPA